jgi:hypothetical protein
MNKRIKELADQAELPTIDGEWDYNDREILHRENGEWRVAIPSEIISVLFACEKGREKFAELIIKECSQLLFAESERLYAYSSECYSVRDSNQAELCADKCIENIEMIEQHFGIE